MKKTIRAIIIDDEDLGRKNLQIMLTKHCPDVEVIDVASSGFEGRTKIIELKPDLVFLDINMPKVNGIELLNSIETRDSFKTIFVTAYDNKEYIKHALSLGAFDYILKPIMAEELKAAVEKATLLLNDKVEAPANPLVDTKSAPVSEKIMITYAGGNDMIELENIVRLEAFSNYCKIYLSNDVVYTSSKTLKSYSELLPEQQFFRIHKSHLINMSHLKNYKSKLGTCYVILKNGVELRVAQNKQSDFKKFLKESFL